MIIEVNIKCSFVIACSEHFAICYIVYYFLTKRLKYRRREDNKETGPLKLGHGAQNIQVEPGIPYSISL